MDSKSVKDTASTCQKYISPCELAAGVLAVLWLQLVGIMSGTVLHHVLHALPIVVLLPMRRTRAVRLTAALVGFIWVFMLSAITPMVHDSLFRGLLFSSGNPDMWLAPLMSLIAGIWAALNLAALNPRRIKWFLLGAVLATPLLAAAHPMVYHAFRVPIEKTVSGQPHWAVLLTAELVLVLAGPLFVFVKATKSRGLSITRQAVLWQALFWLFFMACMIIGLLPGLNPPTSAPLKRSAGIEVDAVLLTDGAGPRGAATVHSFSKRGGI